MSLLKKLLKIPRNFSSAVRTSYNSSRRDLLIPLPVVVENTGRGERQHDIFSRLLQERIIWVMGQVSDEMASVVIAQLLFLQSEHHRKSVHMYINSPGGSVTSGLAIYDTMQYITSPIATWCVGQACSMASLLLAAGTPGLRHALPNSRIMIHQPSGGAKGQATDIQIQAEEIINLKNQISRLYAYHTHQTIEVIETSLERDMFLNPYDAKKFGIIDRVLNGDDIEANEKEAETNDADEKETETDSEE